VTERQGTGRTVRSSGPRLFQYSEGSSTIDVKRVRTGNTKARVPVTFLRESEVTTIVSYGRWAHCYPENPIHRPPQPTVDQRAMDVSPTTL